MPFYAVVWAIGAAWNPFAQRRGVALATLYLGVYVGAWLLVVFVLFRPGALVALVE